MTHQPRNVAILIFDDVEVLDFAGPFEVFSVASELHDPTPFNVYTVAETPDYIRARGGLRVLPDYHIYACPQPDIILIPGGVGTRPLLNKLSILRWLRTQSGRVEHLTSVCTGSLVLAKAGLLNGLTVTTHHDNLDDLRKLVNGKATVVADQRYTDNGHVLTSGGVSAGIDMALHLVHQLAGDEALRVTLTEMEYDWTPNAPLPSILREPPARSDIKPVEVNIDESESINRLLYFWKDM